MNWVSIITLTVTLGVMLSAYRAHHVGAKKTVVYALAWVAIFGVAALIFRALA